MAFLMEQAGGQAFTGKQRVRFINFQTNVIQTSAESNPILELQALDLVPTKIHERSPIFLGSYDDVEEIKSLYEAEGNK